MFHSFLPVFGAADRAGCNDALQSQPGRKKRLDQRNASAYSPRHDGALRPEKSRVLLRETCRPKPYLRRPPLRIGKPGTGLVRFGPRSPTPRKRPHVAAGPLPSAFAWKHQLPLLASGASGNTMKDQKPRNNLGSSQPLSHCGRDVYVFFSSRSSWSQSEGEVAGHSDGKSCLCSTSSRKAAWRA